MFSMKEDRFPGSCAVRAPGCGARLGVGVVVVGSRFAGGIRVVADGIGVVV